MNLTLRPHVILSVRDGSRMQCYTSKVKLLGLLGLACVMVSVSYFCTTPPDPIARVVGWIGEDASWKL